MEKVTTVSTGENSGSSSRDPPSEQTLAGSEPPIQEAATLCETASAGADTGPDSEFPVSSSRRPRNDSSASSTLTKRNVARPGSA